MQYAPPPFFKQGPSARARLIFFALAAFGMLLSDARYDTLSPIRQGVAAALYPIQRIALMPRDAARVVGRFFGDREDLSVENEALKAERLQNAVTLQQAAELAAENASLRRMLDARERAGAAGVFAQVLYDARDPFSRRLVIDRGLRQGLAAGMPAIDEHGVLGQVVRVFPFTAEVALITDREQSIPLQVLRNGLRAVAYGGEQINTLEVRFLAANADIQPGDQLVTSGIDGVYPPGLKVATVASVDRTAANQFAHIVATPIAGVARTSQMLVLQYDARIPPRPEETAPPPSKARKKGAP